MTWGKSVSLAGMLVLMEILPGFAVVTGSDYLDSTLVPYAVFWLLLICGAAGIAAAGGVRAARVKDPWDRVAVIVAGVVAVTAMTWLLPHRANTVIAGFPLCALAYWRGLVWVARSADLDDVQHKFGFGFAGIFLGIIWALARGVTSEGPIWHILALAGITYTGVALIALSVGRTERGSAASASVALAVGATVGFLLVLGLGALAFFSFDIAGWLGAITGPFWNLVGLVLWSVIQIVVSPLIWLTNLAHHNAHTLPQLNGRPPPPRARRHVPLPAGHAPSPWIVWVLGALVLAAAVVAARLIWRAMPRLGRRKEEKKDKSDSTVHSPVPFWKALLAWIRGFSRPKKVPLVLAAATEVRRRLFGPTYPSDPVRRLYAQMLHRAETRGLSRSLAGTPHEFCRLLERRWPDASGDFASMTDAYVLRRYGDMSLEEGQIHVLKQCWQHARRAMREPSSP